MELKIRINKRDEKVVAQILGNKLWCHLNGETFVFDVFENKKKIGAGASLQNNFEIISPMPGKITKILFSEGNSVEKGQAILVMEAMKMEYTLKAEANQKIKEIKVQLGQQVVLGEKLVTFEGVNEKK